MPQPPLISVVIPYYNDQSFLADAINSVLAQTYKNWQLILINHASTDTSRDIAHSFKDERIKHIDLAVNEGATGNFLVQEGLNAAEGKYIKYLSADDYMLPQALEKLSSALEQNEEAALVFGDISFVNEQKEPLGKTWFNTKFQAGLPTAEYLKKLISGESILPYAGHLIRRSALAKIALNCALVSMADMQMWTALLSSGGERKAAFIKESVTCYRIHSQQMCGVANWAKITNRADFESASFIKSILNIDISLNLLKQIFPEKSYIQDLTEEEKYFIPFVMARAILEQSKNPAYRLSAAEKLSDLLSVPQQRQAIAQRFNWGIKDLREDIQKRPIFTHNQEEGNIKNLPLKRLAYYFFRKLTFILLLRDFRHKRADKKRDIL